MYLRPQTTDEGTKLVHLAKRSTGGATAGVVIIVIFVVVAIGISLLSGTKSSNKTQIPTNTQATSRPAMAQAQPPTQPSANLPTQIRDTNTDCPVTLDPRAQAPAAPTNQSEYPDDLVPPYSAKTNENDMGYFDAEGVFHANESMEYPPPPAHVRHSERSSVGTTSSPALARNDTGRITPLMMRTLRY
ncbi:Protein RCR2 [Candida viswanathii]|uniref:Protein RCR2 n=1 Tax=Candida viswanathii TaxID=5486 RepID=A0A367YQS2_9ASCO|nr:Protein RCR2 [Candida viswanathii]